MKPFAALVLIFALAGICHAQSDYPFVTVKTVKIGKGESEQ